MSATSTRRGSGQALADGRSRRVVFLSHCLLNENVRYLGGATRAGVVQEVLDSYTGDGVGIYQMPCPEQQAWGGVLKPRMTRLYGSRVLRWRAPRRVLVLVAQGWTRRVCRRLARRVAMDLADYVGSGFGVVEILGVGASPTCGVFTTIDLDHAMEAMARCEPSIVDVAMVNQRVVSESAVPGRGMFTAALQRELRVRGLEVRFREHDLLAELRGAGALPDAIPRRGAP